MRKQTVSGIEPRSGLRRASPEIGVKVSDMSVVVEVFERPRPAILVECADSEG